MSEHPRTDADGVLWTRGGGAGYRQYARVAHIDGVPRVDLLIIEAPGGIDADLLRTLSMRSTLALAAQVPVTDWHKADSRFGAQVNRALDGWPDPAPRPATPREPLTRPDGTDPDGHARRVARAYVEALETSKTPAKVLADEAGVPVTTVHRWVREARRAGHLPPARKGAAG